MSAPRHRRITIELEFSSEHEHPLQNMARLEQLLEKALENGIKTSEVEIPAVLTARVQVLATASI